MTAEEEYRKLLEQLGFIRGWYGSIAKRENDPKVGEVLDMLDMAINGEDVAAHIQEVTRRMSEGGGAS